MTTRRPARLFPAEQRSRPPRHSPHHQRDAMVGPRPKPGASHDQDHISVGRHGLGAHCGMGDRIRRLLALRHGVTLWKWRRPSIAREIAVNENAAAGAPRAACSLRNSAAIGFRHCPHVSGTRWSLPRQGTGKKAMTTLIRTFTLFAFATVAIGSFPAVADRQS